MAIYYSLELDGSDPEQVSHLFARVAVAERMVKQGQPDFGTDGVLLDSGVHVAVSASPTLPFPDPVEQLGFTPQVHALFRFTSANDPEPQGHDMVRLVSAVLTELRGDVVLTFAGELVWLLRKGGQLTISDRDGLWQPEILALLPRPFKRASLPVL